MKNNKRKGKDLIDEWKKFDLCEREKEGFR